MADEHAAPLREEQVKSSVKRPDLDTDSGRLAFIKILNSRLPKKRLIAQGLLRDDGGRVLLCELRYKKDWDLPGGVVDPGESPAACLAREVREELGLEFIIGGLIAVNWLPPYRGWDDALLLLYDLGQASADHVDQATLQPREISAVHWVAPEDINTHVAPYTAAMIAEALEVVPGRPVELDNSVAREL